MFSLRADDDDATRLGFFSDIRDFFTGHTDALSEFDPEAGTGGEGGGVWVRPRLIGPDAPGALKSALHSAEDSGGDPGNVWIDLHDTAGRTIGSYFAGAATLERWEEEDGGTAVATVSCWLTSLPEAGAYEVWKTWSRRPPTGVNDWVSLPVGRREGWMEVARMYRGGTRKANPRHERYTLDGANIIDLASFYCAIGEAMNGPGGYYGGNLTALDDCLLGGFGPAAPFRLVWEHSDVAMAALGGLPSCLPDSSVLDMIVDCLERRGVTVELA
ncbi:barstar family protein [Streptomyces antibioticus]|uniref:barstar family protein n=1 Tax=Streptomyces antibioticus TaxID=1890 RepID=UPI00225B19E1|nr:barstar family protein [Streptomyces antibioticus]MCX5172063.1 barstar family protein [Streptomyces antibioticus]